MCLRQIGCARVGTRGATHLEASQKSMAGNVIGAATTVHLCNLMTWVRVPPSSEGCSWFGSGDSECLMDRCEAGSAAQPRHKARMSYRRYNTSTDISTNINPGSNSNMNTNTNIDMLGVCQEVYTSTAAAARRRVHDDRARGRC